MVTPKITLELLASAGSGDFPVIDLADYLAGTNYRTKLEEA